MTAEYRSVELVDAELKGHNFRGYAAVFDLPWNDHLAETYGYVEEIRRGTFRKALAAGNDVPLLWQHDRNQLLATTKSGALQLSEDGRGLLVQAKLPKTGLGEYVRELIDRGDVRGMSYGREAGPHDQRFERRGGVVRRIVSGAQRLLDVTLTWEPAYAGTEVELRSAGFVATPLQELLDGAESQIEDAVTESPPDEPEAEWLPDDDPSDKTAPGNSPAPRKWWEVMADEYEREV